MSYLRIYYRGTDAVAVLFIVLIHAILYGIIGTAFAWNHVDENNIFQIEIVIFIIISLMYAGFLYLRRSSGAIKTSKKISDVIWNFWSLAAVTALLFYSYDGISGITAFLDGLGKHGRLIAVALAIPAAVIKLSVAISDFYPVYNNRTEELTQPTDPS